MMMKNFLFLLNFIVIAGIATHAQQIEYRVLPGSKMWIEGTSTLDDYTCGTKDIAGYAEVNDSAEQDRDPANKDKAYLTVMVESLNCGKDLMNDDMYNAMKYQKYPFIKYELIKAHLVTHPILPGDWFKLETYGNLTIAGDTNKVDIIMNVREIKNGIYRLVGSKELSMKDYGIVPPSHFWGLIKAHEGLTVHFDILAAQKFTSGFIVHYRSIK